MSEKRHANVVNVQDIEPREESRGGFGYRARRLGGAAGGKALGCSWYEVPPGKTTFPYHFHSATEEAIYVLEGTGTVRIGDARVEVQAGDYVALPPGPGAAHSVANTGTSPLRYLAMSSPATPNTLDVVAYPDSKKVAYVAGIDPTKGMLRSETWLRGIVKSDQPSLGYYDDEPLAK